MSIAEEIQKLDPSTIITLYEIDATPLGADLYRLHSGTNELNGDIVWQGNTYSAFPIEGNGFDLSTDGKLPRPKLLLANVTSLFSGLLKQYDDFIGVQVKRHRTFVKYLDAVNFIGGVNPTADPAVYFPSDIYFIDRKSAENRAVLEFELASSIDLGGVKLPRRQAIQNTCQWRYRSAECSYAGTNYFDITDAPVGTPEEDVCGKRLNSCKLRFGDYAVLPYGAFVGIGRI